MASMAGKVRREFDAAAAITLRSIDAAARTAAGADASVALNKLTDAYWDNDEFADGVFYLNVVVKSALTTGDQAYTIYVEVDDTAVMSGETRLITVPVSGPGFYELTLSSSLIKQVRANAAFVRIGVAATGDDAKNIVYGGWLSFAGH
jgi:hypothetical protein